MYRTVLIILKLLVFQSFYISALTGDERVLQYHPELQKNAPCPNSSFKCRNLQCVEKGKLCNGIFDCSDASDELDEICKKSYCSAEFFQCNYPSTTQRPRRPSYALFKEDRTTESPYEYFVYAKCIPNSWLCDKVKDCPNEKDELNCIYTENEVSVSSIRLARQKAVEWLLKQKKSDTSDKKWGTEVRRISTALYFADENKFKQKRDEFVYELHIGLLSRMALKHLEDIPTGEIASYINAFLVTCIDPRKFQGLDLVKELRKRVDLTNSANVNPYMILTLCNAGDSITEQDIEKLTEHFKKDQLDFWTDTQALTILALTCAASQSNAAIDDSDLRELTAEIKEKQYRNGTVENIKTTALVLQAVFATDAKPDKESFDEEKALEQILKSQKDDGSFGSVTNTYYVLPALTFKSLVNISNKHCNPATLGEKETILQLINLPGTKYRVQYSLWLGNNRDLERTLHIKMPVNSSFYSLMEMAAKLDPHYRFEYNMKNRKPYIYLISNLQDDPERGTYWFMYKQTNGTDLTMIKKSPADVILSNHEHLIYWYKQP